MPLYHIDLYRLEPSQVPSLHLDEYWRGEDFPLGVVAIEWASKLINIPPQHLKVNLAVPILPAPICPEPMRSPSSEKSQSIDQSIDQCFDLIDLDEEYLEDLPSNRLIQLIAQGSSYVEMLKKFQTTHLFDPHLCP